MANQGSVIPPDVRAQMEKSGRGGIGSAARENVITAKQREAAMNPDAVREADAEETKPPSDKPAELVICPSARCRKKLEDSWVHCAHCGHDLMREGPAKWLGITFTESDIHDYIFKGYVVRELTVLGNHKITVKSSQPSDVAEMDDYIMNGDWAKNKDGTKRDISDFYLRQINQLTMTATGVLQMDGASIGDTLAARMKYLIERGAALVDIMSGRVILFNKALTEHLNKADTLLGS